MKDLNPFDIKVGDIITAYNRGIHKVENILPKLKENKKIEQDPLSIFAPKINQNDIETYDVEYRQLFKDDGKAVDLKRTDICDIKYCKPAILELKDYIERYKNLGILIDFLKKLKD